MITRSRALLAVALTAALSSLGGLSATAVEPVAATASSGCSLAATQLLAANGIDKSASQVDYSCGLGQVSVTATGTDGTEQTFTEEVSAVEDDLGTRAVACDPTQPPTRTIVSELQVNIYLCIVYGQENDPVNGSWAQSIDVDWTVYPGWNSAQSRVSTIPSEGSPTLTGTITSQKQNGILPPTELSSALFTMNGNDSATGYVVGGLNTNGSHSVKMEDLEVTDPAYAFSRVIGPGEATPRFTCDTGQERCYYPNGQEAGL